MLKVALPRRLERLPAGETSLSRIVGPRDAETRAVESVSSRLPSPIHLLVPSDSDWKRTRNVKTHRWGMPLGNGELRKISDNVYVCSPALSFVQSVETMGLVESLLYGHLLCGTYALSASRGATVSRPPLLATGELADFISNHGGARNVRRAQAAAALLLDDSASPMESALAIRLVVPRRLGGMGLDPASISLNHRVEVPSRFVPLLNARHLRIDAFFPSQNVGLEYDSIAFHSGSEKIEHDIRRRTVLEGMGIRTIAVTRGQILDTGEFHGLDEAVSRLLGRRVRRKSVTQRERDHELTMLLRRALSRFDADVQEAGRFMASLR